MRKAKPDTLEEKPMMKIDIPIRTVSEANVRCHWRTKAQRAKRQREAAYMAVFAYLRAETKAIILPVSLRPEAVRLVRIAPRQLDCDNLQGALKAVRDGVSDALGIDDRPGLLEWEYGQERGKVGEYGVRVELL